MISKVFQVAVAKEAIPAAPDRRSKRAQRAIRQIRARPHGLLSRNARRNLPKYILSALDPSRPFVADTAYLDSISAGSTSFCFGLRDHRDNRLVIYFTAGTTIPEMAGYPIGIPRGHIQPRVEVSPSVAQILVQVVASQIKFSEGDPKIKEGISILKNRAGESTPSANQRLRLPIDHPPSMADKRKMEQRAISAIVAEFQAGSQPLGCRLKEIGTHHIEPGSSPWAKINFFCPIGEVDQLRDSAAIRAYLLEIGIDVEVSIFISGSAPILAGPELVKLT